MNRLMMTLALIVAAVAGLGFYLGWFQVTSDTLDHKVHVGLTVDKDKIQADEKKAMGKLRDLGHQGTGANATPTEKSEGQAVSPQRPPQDPQ